MTGGAWDHVRAAMKTLGDRMKYDNMGIETTWQKFSGINIHSARVTVSDSYTGLLWDCIFGLARASAQRLLPLTCGFPRRFTLLLNSDTRDYAIAEFKRHVDNYEQLLSVDAAWTERIKRRSIFNKMSVHQYRLALTLEDWTFAPMARPTGGWRDMQRY